MKNGAAVMVLLVVIATLSLQVLVDLPEEVSAFTPRDPIYIYGNENFTTENGVIGGNGTWNDPYVISGWEIPVTTGRAIYIENATAHFRIENVYIHGADSGPAIYFWQSSNGTIVDSLLENNHLAVSFRFSSNISISTSNITNSRTGIRVANSSSVRVSHITFESCGHLLDLRGSSFVTVHNNTADWGGIFIDGSLKEHFNSHEIAENNTVRGKPIKYVKDCYDLRLNGIDVAQVIVANCSGITLTNLSISGTGAALQLAFVRDGFVSSSYLLDNNFGIVESYSNNITYQDIVISNASERAAWIRYSNDTTFSDCDIRFSYKGIRSAFSRNLTVRESSFHSLVTGGVSSSDSSDMLLKGNWFHKMMYGYKHWRGDNITILENEFRRVEGPIDMSHVNDSLMVGNVLVDSGGNAVIAHTTNRATVVNNTLLRSRSSLFLCSITNSTVKGNRVDSSAHTGLFLGGSNNVISENYVINSLRGIEIRRCGLPWTAPENNIVTKNSVLNNTIGIDVRDSHDNRFFHNNIINNTIQAFDRSASDNEWDDGYPSGGNFWSNYTGPDDFSGPDQDVPGPDGIRDLPFDFDPDTRDDYPLMSPVAVLPPDAPGNLDGELSGSKLKNVTLSWNLSLDDVNGQRSVVRYDILRGTNYSPKSPDYTWHDSVPKRTSQYVDIGAGEGDPYDYFYLVCAVDSSGNSTCSYEQAAKFTRPLSPEPNLVSIPLIQSEESIETVLQTVEYDKAWYYDSSSQEWKWHMTFKDYRRGLWNVNHTIGLWVNVTSDCNLTVAGVVPTNANVQLRSGWNLVGFASFSVTYTVGDLKAGVGATRVEGYGSMSTRYYLRVLENAEVLQTGYAYWVRVEADVAWSVPIQ